MGAENHEEEDGAEYEDYEEYDYANDSYDPINSVYEDMDENKCMSLEIVRDPEQRKKVLDTTDWEKSYHPYTVMKIRRIVATLEKGSRDLLREAVEQQAANRVCTDSRAESPYSWSHGSNGGFSPPWGH